MKIVDVKTYQVRPRWGFVEVITDQGISGWGESVLEGRRRTVHTAVDELKEYLIGRDPFRIEDIWNVLYRGGCYRGGPVLTSALSGIDQALWDIKGKALGVPVYELLGGLCRDRMRCYSWIGGDSPDDVVSQALQKQKEGFDAIKMNGTGVCGFIDSYDTLSAAVERVAAVRRACGPDFGIAVDFHGRIHRPLAKTLIRKLEPYDLMFVEEPVLCEHMEYFKEIAATCTVPIATGEKLFSRTDYKRLFSAGGVDIIQPDPCHAGGITEVRKIMTMAEAFDVAVALHCPLGPIALSVCLQLCAVSPNAVIQEQSIGMHYNTGRDVTDYLLNPGIFSFSDGYLRFPEGPGLGVEMNRQLIEQEDAMAEDWKNPVWRQPDGSYAEW